MATILVVDAPSANAEEARVANARLRALVNIGLELASEQNLDRLLETVCTASRDLFGAVHITLGLIDQQDGTVRHVLDAGLAAQHQTHVGSPPSALVATVVRERQTIRGVDPDSQTRQQLPLLQPDVQAFLLAPIVSPTQSYGWVSLVSNEGRTFSEDDEQLLKALCGQIGRIYEHGDFDRVAQGRTAARERRIAERRHAEALLRKNSALIRSLVEHLPHRIIVKDRHSVMLFCNANYANDLGLSPEQVIGKDAFAFHPAELAAAYNADDRQVMDTETMKDVEEPYRTAPDAPERWMHTVKVPYRDEQGRVIGVLVVFEDITARKATEEALRQSEAFAHAVLNSLTDNIVVLDGQGTITAVNDAWQRFARDNGANAATVHPIGVNYLSVVERAVAKGYPGAQATLQGLRGVLDGERDAFTLEYPCHSPVAHRWWTMSVHSRTDGRAGAVVSHQDITARTELEFELHQSQKLESVGRLAAGVAHEINTPVQFVNDSVHFVQEAIGDLAPLMQSYRDLRVAVANGTATVEAAEDVARAEEAADVDYLLTNIPKALGRSIDGLNRVAVIVRSMKEFAHPDQIEMTSLDLNQAIRSTLIIARNEYKFVADVVTDFGELPPVICHGGDINQVVLNIIVNAAHAIADLVHDTTAKGTITVQTRRDMDAVVIRISDTGGGIPEAIRERIFDPFFTTKEVGRGTGQGLAIARSVVVDKHGGALTFVTEVGHGTTFVVRLPIEGKKQPARMAS